jgi:hypothetical protein
MNSTTFERAVAIGQLAETAYVVAINDARRSIELAGIEIGGAVERDVALAALTDAALLLQGVLDSPSAWQVVGQAHAALDALDGSNTDARTAATLLDRIAAAYRA